MVNPVFPLQELVVPVQKVSRVTSSDDYENEIFKLTNSGPTKRENLCQLCEDVGELLECTGPCLGYFHKSCIGVKTDPPAGTFKCDECQSGKIHLV